MRGVIGALPLTNKNELAREGKETGIGEMAMLSQSLKQPKKGGYWAWPGLCPKPEENRSEISSRKSLGPSAVKEDILNEKI